MIGGPWRPSQGGAGAAAGNSAGGRPLTRGSEMNRLLRRLRRRPAPSAAAPGAAAIAAIAGQLPEGYGDMARASTMAPGVGAVDVTGGAQGLAAEKGRQEDELPSEAEGSGSGSGRPGLGMAA